MIGGIDIRIDAKSCPNPVWIAAFTIFRHWPDATFEDGVTGWTYPDLAAVTSANPSELFVYRDAEAARIWDEEGAVDDALNSMVHLLTDRDELVVVVDDKDDEMLKIISDIEEAVHPRILFVGEDIPVTDGDDTGYIGEKILENAHAFRRATLLIYRDIFPPSRNPDGGLLIPYLVNGSFALELFLKALNSKEDVFPTSDSKSFTSSKIEKAEMEEEENQMLLGNGDWSKLIRVERPLATGHSLVSLFDAIDKKVRDDLSAKFSEAILPGSEMNFRRLILRYDSLFTRLRYPYEGGHRQKDGTAVEISDVLKSVGDIQDLVRTVEFLGDYVETRYQASARGVARKAIRDSHQKN